MSETTQAQDQPASNSLSNALGGEETAVITGYQLSHMIHVPQALYIPRPYESVFKKEETISFTSPGRFGVTLDAALRFQGPKEWETEYFSCLMTSKKITIRVLWPGYTGNDLQIWVRDHTHDSKPLTKSRVVHNIARAVDRMIKEQARADISIQPGHEQWIIDDNITAARVIMTELRHVSKGSWQPVIYIVR